MRTCLLALASLVAIGCNDDGSERSQLVVDLSLDASIALCESYPSRTIVCDGTAVEYGPASCDNGFEPEPTCTETVADVHACYDAIEETADADLCAGILPDECAAFDDGTC